MEVINANNKKALNAFFVKMSTLTSKDLTAIYEGKPLVGLPQVKALSNEYEEEVRKGVAELILESKKNSNFKKAAGEMVLYWQEHSSTSFCLSMIWFSEA